MRRGHVVCMDLGGTNVRLGIVNARGVVLRRRRLRMEAFRRKEDLLKSLGESLAAFVASNKDLGRPRAAALGFAGPTKSGAGLVYYAPNVGCFSNIEVASYLKRVLALPVVVENDANCAALGEFWHGAGRGAGSLFVFTVGTGIGGSFIVGGDVWRGEDGIAGEVGHTVVAMGGPRCSCGTRGCLEALVSATAIVRGYCGPGRRGACKAGTGLTAKMVFDRARQGDRRAQRVVTASGRALGVGIANVFHLLNPELILIGGGVSRAGSMLLDPAIDEARSMIFPPLRARLKVKRTALGDDAGLLGAAYLGFKLP